MQTPVARPSRRLLRRQIDVLREQLQILREIRAPQQLIEVAERVLAEAENKPTAESHPE